MGKEIRKMLKKMAKKIFLKISPSYRATKANIVKTNVLLTRLNKAEQMWWLAQHRSGESLTDTRRRVFREMPIAEGTLRELQNILLLILKELDKVCFLKGLNYWLLGGSVIGAIRHSGFIPWDDDADIGMMRNDYLRLKEALKGNERIELLEFYNFNGFYRLPKLVIKGAQDATDVATIAVDIVLFDFAEGDDVSLWRENVQRRKKLIRKLKWFKLKVLNLHTTQLIPNEQKREQADEIVDKAVSQCCYSMKEGDKIIRGIDNFKNDFRTKCIFPRMKILPVKRLRFEDTDLCVANCYEELAKAEMGDIWQLPPDLGLPKFFTRSKREKEISRHYEVLNAQHYKV